MLQCQWLLAFYIYQHKYNISERLKAINLFICRCFSFYEQLKFRHAQLSWAWKKIYNLGARCYIFDYTLKWSSSRPWIIKIIKISLHIIKSTLHVRNCLCLTKPLKSGKRDLSKIFLNYKMTLSVFVECGDCNNFYTPSTSLSSNRIFARTR